jgi:Ca-activated chloride channel family protein
LIFPWLGLAALYFLKSLKESSSAIGLDDLPQRPGRSPRQWGAILTQGLLWLSGVFLLIALAGPYKTEVEETFSGEGIQIMLSLDVSASMLARDFEPNRLEVAKNVAASFVGRRPFDQIGVAAFAGEAYTVAPLTTDPTSLQQFIHRLDVGQIKDGTAIGMGLATAINRLKKIESPSKIVILLTDGVNNSGYIRPQTAIQMAVEEGVKVYSIGVGSQGEAPVPYARTESGYSYRMARVDIDEELLQEMAQATGGQYFRAENEEELEEIYAVIDALETTEVQVNRISREIPVVQLWLGLALGCWVAFLVLYFFILKIYP